MECFICFRLVQLTSLPDIGIWIGHLKSEKVRQNPCVICKLAVGAQFVIESRPTILCSIACIL